MKEQVEYKITNLNSKHYLKIDSYYGTTHETGFRNMDGNLIKVTNSNNDGYLGLGRDLKGKSITIKGFAEADLDDRGTDRVRLDYFVDDQSSETDVNQYDEPETANPYPYIKFVINFK